MSSDIMYSTKNYRNDWVSQFGLYRYESAATPNRVEFDRRRLVMKITFLLSATLFLALLIFYIAVYMSNYNEVDRMIFLSKFESEPSETSHMSPLTTVFYPDDQIATYQHALSSTTPMSADKRISNHTSLSKAKPIEIDPTIVTWYPSNHKRQYSTVHRNQANDFVANIAFNKLSTTKHTKSPQKRMFFPDDDDDADDVEYVDSYPNVNSIQDILNQNTNEHENVNVNEDFIMPSMPFARTMKVEGVYRREKKNHDQLATMETMQNAQITSAFDSKNGVYETQKFDQFHKFKPSSPGDVNLLATNAMKFKPYSIHKPKPLTTGKMNKFHEDYYGSQDPNIIYHQIVSASNKHSARNGRFEKPSKTNKPFSLMLDVYPMPEDETQSASSTRMTPFNQYRRPIYPINSHAINHNLQYNKENAFYNHLKFPQLQAYPYNRPPYVMTHTPKDGIMRHYATQRMNTNVYRPVLKSKQTFTHDLPTDEAPSQITVHLNLYPDRKKYQTRNVEILNVDTTSPRSVKGARNDISIWKRLEQQENDTTAKLNVFDDQQSYQQSRPFIPPFSAIKINTLQHSFDLNDTDLVQQSSDKSSIDYDSMRFDSRILISNIKSMNFNPTANSIISTSIPLINDIESTASTILTESIAPTSFNQFDTTMSSSTSFTSSINHRSFINTQIPNGVTAAVTDAPNESKLDQPTTVTNIVRFPNH